MARRGSYAKGTARREEILQTALDVFARQGYRGTSLRDVAREVGISLPGLMHHFESKEHLLTAILRKRDEANVQRYDDTESGDEIDTLVRIVGHNRHVPGLVQLYLTLAAAASVAEHPARGFFEHHFDELGGKLVTAIRARQASGDARPDLDPEHAARTLIAVADGLQLRWALDPSIDMAADLERAWELLAH